MTKWPERERRRKLQRDEQFLQAGLCGLVAPSPPPPLHISLQTPAHFCCHLSKLACKFTFMQQLWCGRASCNLYYYVGVVVVWVPFLLILHKNTARHPVRLSSWNKGEICLILINSLEKMIAGINWYLMCCKEKQKVRGIGCSLYGAIWRNCSPNKEISVIMYSCPHCWKGNQHSPKSIETKLLRNNWGQKKQKTAPYISTSF